MLLPLSDLRLTSIDDLQPGSIVLSVGYEGHDEALSVVVDAGEFSPGKALLALGGKKAFIPRRAGDNLLLALTNRRLHVRLGEPSKKAPDNYRTGQISVDADGPYLILQLERASRNKTYLLSLSSFKIEEAFLRDPAFWPASWELIARSATPGDDIQVGRYPADMTSPSDDARGTGESEARLQVFPPPPAG